MKRGLNMYKQFLLVCFLVLTACSHKQNIGDRMISQEQHINQISTEWQAGNELVRKGNKTIRSGQSMVKKGNQLVEKGYTKISKGKKMVKNGEKMMKRSQKVFAKEFPNDVEEE